MKAKFIGTTSMGFRTGQLYNVRSKLKEVHCGGYIFGYDTLCICIYDNNSNAWCPYKNLEAVMENWDFNI